MRSTAIIFASARARKTRERCSGERFNRDASALFETLRVIVTAPDLMLGVTCSSKKVASRLRAVVPSTSASSMLERKRSQVAPSNRKANAWSWFRPVEHDRFGHM